MKRIKKSVFILGWIVSAVFCMEMAAQLPSVSTADSPKWYYVQVQGTGNAANRVLADVDGQAVGQAIAFEDIDLINKQLWRFELESSAYVIINKSSGRKLSVVYDEAKNLRIATVSDQPSTAWTFVNRGSGYYNIRMKTQPAGGTTGNTSLYQMTATQNYGYKFVGTADAGTVNAYFQFIVNETPVISTEGNVVWLFIKNVKTDKYLTDVVATHPEPVKFTLTDLETGNNEDRQWKMIAKGADRVEFVNRATGNIIHTNTRFERYYYTQCTTDPEESEGWKFNSLGGNQYEIYTDNPAGVAKYWNATEAGVPADIYSKGSVLNSSYAWHFTWASEERTGIEELVPFAVRVYSNNKRIYVEGCDDYRIVTLYGTRVSRNVDLPTGIYLVTAKGKTTKVLVK